MSRRVAIAATSALSAFGAGTRGLGRALAAGGALPGLPAETPLASPRVRKMMSPAAYLAARCLADLMGEVAWTDREEIGCFLGVGASGGAIEDFVALLRESLAGGTYSLARFGDRGLAACNPLLAFQLMNNFTLCHAAIQERLGGPNSAVFSRGAGTVAAIGEAVHAVRAGECDRAIAGGADAATHPATLAELAREGRIARGLVAVDAAALLAIDVHGATAIDGCAIASGRARGGADALDEAASRAGDARGCSLAVIAPWGPPADDALRSWLAVRAPAARIVSTAALGDSLAATPALAVIAAADLLEPGQRAIVLSLGADDDPGAVFLSRRAS